jgi:hypothetical protein
MHEKLEGGFTADAHCWATATGQSFSDQPEGKCYWPIQWAYVIIAYYGY